MKHRIQSRVPGICLAVKTVPMLAFAMLAWSALAWSEAPVEAATSAMTARPYRIERFQRSGPLAGVVARIDLGNPRVEVRVALTDDRDPDGTGPCVGQLETVSQAARKHDFDLTINASFFAAPVARESEGRLLRYYVGSCTHPVGWHISAGRTVTKPAGERLRAALVIDAEGRAAIVENLREPPAKTRYAVSGNTLVLKDGALPVRENDAARHPRSVVGLSRDGKTLFLVAVDGRQAGGDGPSLTGQEYSRGATYAELGELMRELGAWDALNLDGGGSTALVVKDAATGVFSLANQPSDRALNKWPIAIERPVADVIGVRLKPMP